MTAADIEHEIRAISDRLKSLDKDTPEMTSMDWANDHGWISTEEWESAQEKSTSGVKLQEAEVAKIEALRDAHPHAMDEFLGIHIDRLKRARDALQTLSDAARRQQQDFAMRFNLSLLPDIIAALKAWRGKTKTRRWMSWAWRVAFSVVEESEKFIEHEKRKEGKLHG